MFPNPTAATGTPREHPDSLARIYALLRLVVAVAAVALLLWVFGDVLTVVFAAALLATILHGVANLLHRWTRLPFWAALTLVILGFTALLVGLGFKAGPGLSDQADSLRKVLIAQAQNLQSRLEHTDWGRFILNQLPVSLGGDRHSGLSSLPFGFAGSIAGYLGTIVGTLGTAAVVLIAAIYFAAAPATYVNGALRLVVPRHRARAKLYCETAGKALWAWSAGQALDMLVVGTLSGAGLWFIGVPLTLVLAVVAGLFNFVPYIGAIVGAVPAVIIAFSVGTSEGVETLILYSAIQAFEGNVLSPMIQRRAVHMPPGLTILAQTAFGAVLGIAGLIFATPLTAAILAVVDKATTPLAAEDQV